MGRNGSDLGGDYSAHTDRRWGLPLLFRPRASENDIWGSVCKQPSGHPTDPRRLWCKTASNVPFLPECTPAASSDARAKCYKTRRHPQSKIICIYRWRVKLHMPLLFLGTWTNSNQFSALDRVARSWFGWRATHLRFGLQWSIGKAAVYVHSGFTVRRYMSRQWPARFHWVWMDTSAASGRSFHVRQAHSLLVCLFIYAFREGGRPRWLKQTHHSIFVTAGSDTEGSPPRAHSWMMT